DQQTAVEFYRQKVAKVASLWQADPAIPDTDRRAYRAVLRSDAIWLLSGRDKPEKPEEFEYLDPLDYVSWALAHDDLTVPETLVGPTHGDLHGQNILVGVQRNEAVWPVVFDYGEMGTRNLLVWDFVKLETELKTRVLPRLYHDAAARAALLSRPSRLPRGDHPSSPYTLPERDRADRANRLAFVFQFEKLLAEETSRIQSEDLAAARTPPRGRDLVPGQAPLNRILSILIRIRQEAALCLGYHHNGRFATWSEEFYFALAVYGLTTAKWETYEDPQTESVLISAGVACAQLGVARQALRPTAISGTASAHSSPHRPASYRVPLFLAHEAWKRKEHAVALALLQDAERQFPRCTPLQAEYALNLAEQGETERSIQLVEPLRALCHVFGDFETLTRIGRCFKEIADRQWQQLHDRINHVEGETVRQMFVPAFEVYYEAYRMSGDYFPGVNAATLALLSGQDPALVHEIALSVKTVCQRARITTQRDDRYWIFASEGEVSLVLDDVNRAAECYLAALAELKAENLRFAQSTWNQVCRLWHFLGDRVEPVALVFERDPLVRTSLDLGPFENCRRNWPNRPLLSEINRQQAWRHFQKTKPIWARRLEQAETVKTLEGELHASAGDYVCRGIAGELWPQQANKLEAKYTPTDTIDPAGWRKFEPRPDAAGVFAAQVPRTFSVTATWGELKGKAGDYLVKHAANQKTLYPDDVWIVDQSLFDATYEWVDSPTMLAASPTEMRT
ncbi:MAG: hypothetical protein H7062_05215, partial [Candidatus Saccharimonas sp.]|nr:hypothetical protein [Planctomycetaceae bacterium]